MPTAVSGYALEQLKDTAPPPQGTPARLLADARAEAELIGERAREDGYAEGLARGREDGVAQTLQAARALQEALVAVRRHAEVLAAAVEADAVELSLALAEKVLAGALGAQPERVLDAVAGALRRIADRRRIVILVDPLDLEVVAGAIGELQSQAGGVELCELQADRRVGRGGAIVRTPDGEVDATVQTQLERAREVVAAALRGEEQR